MSLALGGRSKIDFIYKNNAALDAKLTQYKSLFSNDHMIQSWILNIMEPYIAVIFNYTEYVAYLLEKVKEMYWNQNNVACVFQLKKDISCLPQKSKSFVLYL